MGLTLSKTQRFCLFENMCFYLAIHLSNRSVMNEFLLDSALMRQQTGKQFTELTHHILKHIHIRTHILHHLHHVLSATHLSKLSVTLYQQSNNHLPSEDSLTFATAA